MLRTQMMTRFMRKLAAIRGSVAKNLLCFGLSLTLTLVFAEIVVRYAAPQKLYRFPKGMFVNHPALGFRLRPDFRSTASTTEYWTHIRTNSLGLREDTEYGEKAPDTYRVLAIGDSFTMGVGVESNDCFVKVLEQLLNSKDSRHCYQVINAGVPGYNTRQAVTYLHEDGLRLNPDLVLLNFFVGNDIEDNVEEPRLTVQDGYLQNWPAPKGLLPYRLRLFLGAQSHLYKFLSLSELRLFSSSFVDYEKRSEARHLSIYASQNEERNAQMWSATLEQLGRLADVVSKRRILAAVVVIPEQLQTDARKWSNAVGESGNEFEADKPNRKLTELCLGLNLPVLDLLPKFRESGNRKIYLELDSHLTRVGHNLAAQAILPFLEEKQLIPASTSTRTVRD